METARLSTGGDAPVHQVRNAAVGIRRCGGPLRGGGGRTTPRGVSAFVGGCSPLGRVGSRQIGLSAT